MDRSPCSKPPRCGHRRCYPTWRLVQSRAGRCRHSEKSLYQQLLSSWERVPGGGEHPMKTKGIGYVRVSTDKQADRGVSLEAQVEKIRAMATVHDVELLDVLVDAGESAKD